MELWLVLLAACGAAAQSMDQFHPPDCKSGGPQQSVDLEQVLGMWFAVEVVQHWEGPKSRLVLGTTVVDSCPVLHLQRLDEHHIRLLWTEDAGVIEYNFSIPNLHSPGFWITYGAQNGSLVMHRRYRQFAGTIEVTKAVGTHMVLTFCTPRQELYSVVMARDKWLPKGELDGVNRMLENRRLPKLSVKEACKGAAALTAAQGGLHLLLLAALLGWRNYCAS